MPSKWDVLKVTIVSMLSNELAQLESQNNTGVKLLLDAGHVVATVSTEGLENSAKQFLEHAVKGGFGEIKCVKCQFLPN